MGQSAEKNSELNSQAPILVAHRGYSGRYPENTLLAYQAAYQHGARYMELDLQLTADAVPVLHHDPSLMRMAGIEQDIRETKCKHFKSLSASYPARFDREYADNKFTTFSKYCKWLKKHPEVVTFVEIKQESIDSFGIPLFIDQVIKRINKFALQEQCVIISFNHQALDYVAKVSSLKTGFVLPEWDQQNKQIADTQGYQYLFAGTEQLPEDDAELWRGSWQWAVYNLDDVESALAMAQRGIGMLETNQIGTLMADPRLRPSED